jgi:hypothetical protein
MFIAQSNDRDSAQESKLRQAQNQCRAKKVRSLRNEKITQSIRPVPRRKEVAIHAKLVSFAASIRSGRRESVGLPTG